MGARLRMDSYWTVPKSISNSLRKGGAGRIENTHWQIRRERCWNLTRV
jgi:hypothetical protein